MASAKQEPRVVAAPDVQYSRPGREHGGDRERFRHSPSAIRRIPIGNQIVLTHALRDQLHRNITFSVPNALLNGHPDERLPNTLNLSFPGIDSTKLQAAVRDRVACSTGCGCHAGKTAPSATLLAIGRDEGLATAALRLTLGVETTEAEIDEAASVHVSAASDILARSESHDGTFTEQRR